MTTPIPKFSSHTFKQECAIADGPEPKRVIADGYTFNAGKRKFQDKVDKNKSYD